MPGKTTSINIALLGAGIFAREEHLPSLIASPKFNLKAVYSRSRKSAAALIGANAELKDVDIYSDDSPAGQTLEALLARPDIDAVDLVMPIPAQPAILRQIWKAGKHVISEKPVAASMREARALMDDYKKLSTPRPLWAVAEQIRYLKPFDAVAEAARELGDVQHFALELYAHSEPGSKYYETAWRQESSFPGYLVDGGVHFAAGLRRVLSSQPARVSAFSNQIRPYLPPVDTFNATVALKSGATGTFNMSFGSNAKKLELQLAAEKGSLTFSNMSHLVVTDVEGKVTLDEKFDTTSQQAVQRELEAFADGIEQGELQLFSTADEALQDLALIESILESGKAGGATISL